MYVWSWPILENCNVVRSDQKEHLLDVQRSRQASTQITGWKAHACLSLGIQFWLLLLHTHTHTHTYIHTYICSQMRQQIEFSPIEDKRQSTDYKDFQTVGQNY
jgi:hypothetical protein